MPTRPDVQAKSRPRFWVEMKVAWVDTITNPGQSGNWFFVPYMNPLQWFNALSPQVPMAFLQWDYGRIARHDKAATVDHDIFPEPDAHAWARYNVDGLFVRIMGVVENEDGTKRIDQFWIGVVSSFSLSDEGAEVFEGLGNELPAGSQLITCSGLRYLLDRKVIGNAAVLSRDSGAAIPDDELAAAQVIDWAPDFNRSAQSGDLLGNKSFPPLFVNGVETDPVFSEDRDPFDAIFNDPDLYVWGDPEKVQYLLRFQQPVRSLDETVIDQYNLIGDEEPRFVCNDYRRLYGIGRVTEQAGRTIADILDELASPEMGIGWYVHCDKAMADSGGQPEIRFVSRFGEDVTVGNAVVVLGPANVVSPSLMQNRKAGAVSIQDSFTRTFSRVRCVGERMRSVFTVSAFVGDANLATDWSGAIHSEYDAGVSISNTLYASLDESDKATYNDRRRDDSYFDGVLSRFAVEKSWDWLSVFGGPNFDPPIDPIVHNPFPVVPMVDEYGQIVRSQDSNPWKRGREFLTSLPMFVGFDYANPDDATANVAANRYSPNAWPPRLRVGQTVTGEPMRPLVFCADHYIETDIKQFRNVETPAGGRHAVVRNIKDLLALDVRFNPRHWMSRGIWALVAEPSRVNPDDTNIDEKTGQSPSQNSTEYGSIIATVAIETDEVLQVIVDNPLAIGATGVNAFLEREMVVSVRDAHLWYMVPRTVVGVRSSDSKLAHAYDVDPNDPDQQVGRNIMGVLRNDAVTLDRVAQVAIAWHGVVRRSAVIPFTNHVPAYGVGDYIDVFDKDKVYETRINSIVARVIYNNNADTVSVTVQTSDSQIDPVLVVRRSGH